MRIPLYQYFILYIQTGIWYGLNAIPLLFVLSLVDVIIVSEKKALPLLFRAFLSRWRIWKHFSNASFLSLFSYPD